MAAGRTHVLMRTVWHGTPADRAVRERARLAARERRAPARPPVHIVLLFRPHRYALVRDTSAHLGMPAPDTHPFTSLFF